MSDRPTKHEVKAGEQHVPRVAIDHGFQVIQPIWDAPENAELRRIRVNPNTLAVGDVVIVPADDPKTEPRATQQVNVFTVLGDRTILTLRLFDEARRPLAGRPFRFVAGTVGTAAGRTVNLQPDIVSVTDANGFASVAIARRATEGEITLAAVPADPVAKTPAAPEVRLRLIIGALDPVNSRSGVRSRLNNLGYFAGFTDADVEQLAWAWEEFQVEHGIKKPTPLDDAAAFITVANLLAHEHGDLLASERVPES